MKEKENNTNLILEKPENLVEIDKKTYEKDFNSMKYKNFFSEGNDNNSEINNEDDIKENILNWLKNI